MLSITVMQVENISTSYFIPNKSVVWNSWCYGIFHLHLQMLSGIDRTVRIFSISNLVTNTDAVWNSKTGGSFSTSYLVLNKNVAWNNQAGVNIPISFLYKWKESLRKSCTWKIFKFIFYTKSKCPMGYFHVHHSY